MIIKEFYMTRNDGVGLYKTLSDKNVYIIKKTLSKNMMRQLTLKTLTIFMKKRRK